ncbi:hypothetical protein ADJ70_08945 [Olsenella sp. oral taxon 807]|nr:hypothetical protein ADJ70_08945 [Olsenella sp. oral taxon 807]
MPTRSPPPTFAAQDGSPSWPFSYSCDVAPPLVSPVPRAVTPSRLAMISALEPCSLICAAPPMSATSRARTEATSSVATVTLLPWEVCVRRRGTCYLQVPSSP